MYSFHSIPSSLNMRYVGKDNEWDDQESRQLLEMADDHALGRILKALGYNYVHVSAGWLATETSRNADLVVDFAPSGRLLPGPKTEILFVGEVLEHIREIHYHFPAYDRGQALPVARIQR